MYWYAVKTMTCNETDLRCVFIQIAPEAEEFGQFGWGANVNRSFEIFPRYRDEMRLSRVVLKEHISSPQTLLDAWMGCFPELVCSLVSSHQLWAAFSLLLGKISPQHVAGLHSCCTVGLVTNSRSRWDYSKKVVQVLINPYTVSSVVLCK